MHPSLAHIHTHTPVRPHTFSPAPRAHTPSLGVQGTRMHAPPLVLVHIGRGKLIIVHSLAGRCVTTHDILAVSNTERRLAAFALKYLAGSPHHAPHLTAHMFACA